MGLHQVVELFMRVRRIILQSERTMDLQILRFPEGSWGVLSQRGSPFALALAQLPTWRYG